MLRLCLISVKSRLICNNHLIDRREVQFNQLTALEAQFSTSQAEAFHMEERIKALEIAMQMAREVRRVPFLEQYCTLDKV